MNSIDPSSHESERKSRIVLLIGILFCAMIAMGHSAPIEPVVVEPQVQSAEDEAATSYFNWANLSVGAAISNGDDAAFMHRHRMPDGFSGGVDEFHWEKFFGDNGLLQIDGRGIFDAHDYLLEIDVSDTEKGYIRAGYREFRSWYDGSGGFFPQNGQWLEVFDDELHLDRGEAWIEGGLTLPDMPVLTVRYVYSFREGKKGSTTWGPTGMTGGFGTRNIVPSFYDIDEERNVVSADVRHTISNTDFGLGVRYEFSDQDNSRNMRLNPNEPVLDRHVTQNDEVETDLFNTHFFTETRFNEKVKFTTGYSFTTLDTDISGSRIYGPGYDPVYDPGFARRQPFDSGFIMLTGGSQLDQHVVHLNLMGRLFEHLTLVPSLRVEQRDVSSLSGYQDRNISMPTSLETFRADSDRGLLDVSERLELRYNGLEDWVFYARGDWTQGSGDLQETRMNSTQNRLLIDRDSDEDRFIQKYTVGANWYPLAQLNFGVQYYRKMQDVDYDHDRVFRAPGEFMYPGFITRQEFETDDFNIRATWRPLRTLTFITRYDIQFSTIDSAGLTLGKSETGETTVHVLSESITWTPWSRLYLQGNFSYIMNQTETPAADLSGSGENLLPDAKNDYWNVSALSGFVIDNKTDLQLQYLFYKADNYIDFSATGLPYGAEAEEHGVVGKLVRKMRDNLIWTLQYGFFTLNEHTSGGNNDYNAHVVASGVQYRF